MDKLKDKRVIAALVLVFIMLLAVMYYASVVGSPDIYKGVKVGDVNVSNLTKEEAISKITTEKIEQNKEKAIIFTDGDKEYKVAYKDLGYELDINRAVDDAILVGRTSNVAKNFIDIVVSPILNKNISLNEKFSEEGIQNALAYLEKEVNVAPVDASVTYSDENGFSLNKEQAGKSLDLEKTKALILKSLESKDVLVLPVNVSNPKILSTDFEGIDTLFAQFSTEYSKSSKGRKENIKLASSFLNGLMVKPGEEISFNNAVGNVSAERGFKESNVIINGEFDTGIGGGICQVSTTLYNALIRADLEITERTNHSRPISYVPLGTDAAVAEGYKDLKFKNNTAHNIYILSMANDDEITFQVFGNSADRDYKVEIVPKLLSVNQPNVIKKYTQKLAAGDSEVEKSGSKGYSYVTYKNIIKNGEITETVRISNSNYISQDKVILIGEGSGKNSDDKKSDDSNKEKKNNLKNSKKDKEKDDNEKSSKTEKSSKKKSNKEK